VRSSTGRRGGRHRLAEAHRDAIRNSAGQLPEKASAFKAEDASPHSIEVHRDDGDLDAFHDAFQPVAEGKQLAGARDLPFGENAHDFIVA